MNNFIGPLVECNQEIKGFGGTSTGGVKIGRIRWDWLYNTGKGHKFLTPSSYCVTQVGERLLIPQQWEQVQKDDNPIQGTCSTIYARDVRLY